MDTTFSLVVLPEPYGNQIEYWGQECDFTWQWLWSSIISCPRLWTFQKIYKLVNWNQKNPDQNFRYQHTYEGVPGICTFTCRWYGTFWLAVCSCKDIYIQTQLIIIKSVMPSNIFLKSKIMILLRLMTIYFGSFDSI